MGRDARIGDNTIVVQNTEPVAVEVDRSVVMMSLERGKYYGLEGVGGRIWQLIEEPRSVAELCTTLEREFDVDHEQCRREVVEFLTELAQEGLIEVRGEASDPLRPSSST